MKAPSRPSAVAGALFPLALVAVLAGCTAGAAAPTALEPEVRRADGARVGKDGVLEAAERRLAEGRRIFRFDTFGDEAFWGGALRIHEAIEGAAHGGVGPGVSPRAALAAGLKVDLDALAPETVAALVAGQVDLDDPATTLALLRQGAVVGLTGFPDGRGGLRSVGLQCALCHSRVDDALAPGIGHRLDGWPNQDLDVGRIVSLSPDLSPVASFLGVPEATLRAVLGAWGPGRYDAAVFLDGKALRPDGAPATTLIPPAFGLAGVNLHTFTGWGGVSHWNALVATLEMHGQGTLLDARLDDAARYPLAAAHRLGHTRSEPDLVTSKLPALHLYQLALEPPPAPAGSFDAAAAARGRAVFAGAGRCAECHVPPLFTEPGWNLHTAQELGIDDFQAQRGPDGRYRTSPLRGLWTHPKRGYYHDGRFATLGDVVDHYDVAFGLGLTAAERDDLAEYLKSL